MRGRCQFPAGCSNRGTKNFPAIRRDYWVCDECFEELLSFYENRSPKRSVPK